MSPRARYLFAFNHSAMDYTKEEAADAVEAASELGIEWQARGASDGVKPRVIPGLEHTVEKCASCNGVATKSPTQASV